MPSTFQQSVPCFLGILLLFSNLSAAAPGGSLPIVPEPQSNPKLLPLLAPETDLTAWKLERTKLLARWEAALGSPGNLNYPPEQELVEEFTTPDFRGLLYRQRTGDSMQQVLLMIPIGWKAPVAGVVVPFYDPDRMCGYDLKTKAALGPERNTAYFALHLVRQGYVVAACEAYPFNILPPESVTANRGDFKIWQTAAKQLALRYPDWTGMGKLTYDGRKAIDLLAASGFADPQQLAIMGHSLGGKIAFYAGCFDERIKAIVASDFGIGWTQTNWSDDWYFGARLSKMQSDGLAHHQLLACKMPGAFFLIAGQYDHSGSRAYLEEARKVQALYGPEDNLAIFDHHSGHQPSWDSLKAAYNWLAQKMGMPKPDLLFMDAMADEQAKSQTKR